jgi:hypothetical protein
VDDLDSLYPGVHSFWDLDWHDFTRTLLIEARKRKNSTGNSGDLRAFFRANDGHDATIGWNLLLQDPFITPDQVCAMCCQSGSEFCGQQRG